MSTTNRSGWRHEHDALDDGLSPEQRRDAELEDRVQRLNRLWKQEDEKRLGPWNGGPAAQGPVADFAICSDLDPERLLARRIIDLFGYGTRDRIQHYVEDVMPAYRWALGDGGEPSHVVAVEFAARRVWDSQRDLIEKSLAQDILHGKCFRYDERDYGIDWLTPQVAPPTVLQWSPPRYEGDEESQVHEPLYVWSDPEKVRRWKADAGLAARDGYVVDPIFGSASADRDPDIEVEPSRILGLDMCRAPLGALNLSARAFLQRLKPRACVRVAGGATPMAAHAVSIWMPGKTVEYENILAGFDGHRAERPGTLDGAIVMVPSYGASAYWYAAKAFENVFEVVNEDGKKELRTEAKHFDFETHRRARDQRSARPCPLGAWLLEGALRSMRPGGLVAVVSSTEGVSSYVIPALDEYPGLERVDGVVDGHVVVPVNRPLVCRYDRERGQPWNALDTRRPDDMFLTVWRATHA